MNKKVTHPSWTLFLDRDGVINERIPGRYIQHWDEFQFTPNCLEAIAMFGKIFQTIVVVTNQQGIDKGIMTKEELEKVHQTLLSKVKNSEGHIDKVYYCPHLKIHNPPCRKPNTGMAWQAKKDFPHIDFQKSIMVGDSFSDMEFGWQLGMRTVFIEGKSEENERTANIPVDARFENLWQFAQSLQAPLVNILMD